MVSVRQLRYFVEIVECGSFSQAAERMCVAQSAISRQLKELESFVQVELLRRSSRHIELTPAGKVLYDGAKRLLYQLNETLVGTRNAERDGAGVIRVTHSSSVPIAGELLRHVNAVLAESPNLSLDISQLPSEHQGADVEDGRSDVGLVRLPVHHKHPHVVLEELYVEELRLAVPRSHPLAMEHAVSVAALREERFVSMPHGERGGLSFRVTELCMKHGFFPQAARAVSRKTTLLNLVDAGLGVALVPESMRAIAPESVVFVALEGAESATTVGILYRQGASAAVMAFVSALKSRWTLKAARSERLGTEQRRTQPM